jgi:hypothetical protein
MPTLTLTTLATDAALYLGILDSGGSLSSAQLQDALRAANDFLDNWSSEEIMVPGLLLQTFSLVAGTGSYLIGTGLTFNVTRPMAIEAAVHVNTMNGVPYETPIKIVNGAEWASLDNRAASNNIIDFLFYDRQIANAKVYVSPRPLGGSIELTMWTALTQFVDTTTAITIPFGYAQPMKYAMAMAMAPQYMMAPTEALVKNNMDSLARLRDLNAALLGRKPPAGQTEAATAPPSMIQTS